MEITINLINEFDAQELFEFELRNRGFFEKMVPSRGNDYYTWDTFIERHRQLLNEQERGLSHYYLIKDKPGNIAGRINLVDIDLTTNEAEIGFRIGEAYVGKGIANRALNLLLNSESTIETIHAKTTTVNYASQKVLEKNGFIQTKISDEDFQMNAQKMKFVHYLWERRNFGLEK
ncbi:GNAT family N-acetyltransferase [Planococcus shixiaomingii]|uniref:GNAT family N-acetyltransferase n=1 Tax=Planococcus shixiaomingii TaxID=3058393 RepID=UPI002627AFBC|nr:GNAT family N-acetyltransferase [Planococcus sp. N022]WKA56575.1 GNAT family N-acetyltransferase [Planococcus sp. N022]